MSTEVEAIAGFIFLDSKIHRDGDCSYELKKNLLLEKKWFPNHYQQLVKSGFFPMGNESQALYLIISGIFKSNE